MNTITQLGGEDIRPFSPDTISAHVVVKIIKQGQQFAGKITGLTLGPDGRCAVRAEPLIKFRRKPHRALSGLEEPLFTPTDKLTIDNVSESERPFVLDKPERVHSDKAPDNVLMIRFLDGELILSKSKVDLEDFEGLLKPPS